MMHTYHNQSPDQFSRLIRQTWRQARRLIVLVIGTTVLLLGLAGIVLPVLPAMLLIPAGLAILATEFVWAARLLRRVRQEIRILLRRRQEAAEAEVRPSQSEVREPDL